jgi:hypothetical protein
MRLKTFASMSMLLLPIAQANLAAAQTIPDEPGLQRGTGAHINPLKLPDSPTPAAPGGGVQLVYNGGTVIPSVKVIPVFWSPKVRYLNDLTWFYYETANSAHLDWLSEYNTATQSIGRGRYGGMLTLQHAPPGPTIDDTDIQNELAMLIHRKYLPVNDGNMLFMVHFPPGLTVTMKGSASCEVFCAYHGTFKLDGVMTYYGVIPDQGGACASGCGGGLSSQLDVTTMSSSHEMVEAITDPSVGLADSGVALAWYDDAYGEIGDMCNGQPSRVGRWAVQQEWSNAKNACIAAADDPNPTPAGSAGGGGNSGKGDPDDPRKKPGDPNQTRQGPSVQQDWP